MKKIHDYFFIVLVIVLLTACSQVEETQDVKEAGYQLFTEEMINADYQSFSVEDENFIMDTYINKLIFEENENIDIFSTLEYIGDGESIQVWSLGNIYFRHNIFDGHIYYHKNAVTTTLTTIKLIKGKVYLLPFVKSGSWTNDPKDEFWKQYYTDKELKLSKGEYTVIAATAFSLDEELIDKVRLKTEFQVKVN